MTLLYDEDVWSANPPIGHPSLPNPTEHDSLLRSPGIHDLLIGRYLPKDHRLRGSGRGGVIGQPGSVKSCV